MTATTTATPSPIRVSYPALLADPAGVRADLEAALGNGAGALGVILVGDLPAEFPAAREKLFRLGRVYARLPPAKHEECERPETSYFFGWSHGKEIMNGKPDTAKGSYYANPLLDVPAVSDEQRAACPEYYSGNVWPTIPEAAGLEEAFKALGRIIADVGLAIAHAADSAGLVPQRSLRDLIAGSQSNKARLLHYYPQSEDAGAGADDACGSHLDHSVLTGLCCAMYLDEEANIVPAPSANAGLFIYPRGGGDAVKVSIPPDCLAFQTGEAIELLSDGNLRATRHYVSSGNGATGGVSRETYAFFLQPDVDDVIAANGETFGQFTKRIIERHYGDGM